MSDVGTSRVAVVWVPFSSIVWAGSGESESAQSVVSGGPGGGYGALVPVAKSLQEWVDSNLASDVSFDPNKVKKVRWKDA